MKRILLILVTTLIIIGFIYYLEHRGIVIWRLQLPIPIADNNQNSTPSPLDQTNTSPTLKIVFMDIGQGDSTLITFPNGKKMLVDCARDSVVLSALGRNMSWFDHDIDYLVATHPDADHYGGCIDVLKRYTVKHIYFNGFEKENSQLLQVFHQTVAAEEYDGALYTVVTSTQSFIIAGVAVRFLYPDHDLIVDPHIPGDSVVDSNNTSIVMKISYGDEDVLMTGDMEMPLENYLVQKLGKDLQVEVLKVGHHGSKSSSGEEFLHIVSPEYSTISDGKDNSYGHPSIRALKRLERTGTTILRTDLVGDILATITTSTIQVSHESTS